MGQDVGVFPRYVDLLGAGVKGAQDSWVVDNGMAPVLRPPQRLLVEVFLSSPHAAYEHALKRSNDAPADSHLLHRFRASRQPLTVLKGVELSHPLRRGAGLLYSLLRCAPSRVVPLRCGLDHGTKTAVAIELVADPSRRNSELLQLSRTQLLAVIRLVQDLGLEVSYVHLLHGAEELRAVVVLEVGRFGVRAASETEHHLLLVEGLEVRLLRLVDDVRLVGVLVWSDIDVDMIAVGAASPPDVAVGVQHRGGTRLSAVGVLPVPLRALVVLDADVEVLELHPSFELVGGRGLALPLHEVLPLFRSHMGAQLPGLVVLQMRGHPSDTGRHPNTGHRISVLVTYDLGGLSGDPLPSIS